MTDLGHIAPATEALFAAAFAESALITARAAARLLGIDEKTLAALVAADAIETVLIGRQKRFSEAGIRAFISSGGNALKRPDTGRVSARGPRQKGFTELAAERQAARAASRTSRS
jgi:hypothetical protein